MPHVEIFRPLRRIELQPDQQAVDPAPRAHPLDDFLSRIAALGERDGVELLGFMGNVFAAVVDAVARDAVLDADNFEVFLGRRRDAAAFQPTQNFAVLSAAGAEPESIVAGQRNPRDPNAVRLHEAEFLGWNRAAEIPGRSGRARPGNGERASLFRNVLQGDVIHDDEAFQVLPQPLAASGLAVEQDVVLGNEDPAVGLNAALRVEKERVRALPRRELVERIAGDRMQQPDAVFARCSYPAARGNIQPRGAFVKRPITLPRTLHCKAVSIPAMIHEILPVGALQCNCSVFGDESTGSAIVVDPGDEIDRIEAVLERHGLQVTGIVVTHAHIDHIGGAAKLRARTGAPVYMNENDIALRDMLDTQASWIGSRDPEKTEIDVTVKDGDAIKLADTDFQVLHTPGHTQGSICLLIESENKLIAGDTLFSGSIGRTDLPGGNQRRIFASIKDKLLTLDDSVAVTCGHGPSTTIGRERRWNPFLRGL